MAADTYSEWDLSLVPNISFSFVDQYALSKSSASGQKHQSKGYKYFGEGYIHNMTVHPSIDSDYIVKIKARCHRSQKKNESPHTMNIFIKTGPEIKDASCTCVIGQGKTCGHICGALYTIALMKGQGKNSIPRDIARTSLPQTWHIPRGPTISSISADDIQVCSHKRSSHASPTVRQVKSTLYDPVRGELPDWQILHDNISEKYPDILILPALAQASHIPKDVPSKFGLVPKGCILSYQQRLHTDVSVNLFDGVPYPDLPADNFMVNNYNHVLVRSAQTRLDSLSITLEDVNKFESITHEQSRHPLFYQLREHRLTASKIHRVITRRENFEKLAADLKSTRKVQTAAMKRGITMEPVAADVYITIKNNDINAYPCGVVVNPWSFWLAASPDRKIYDPSRVPPFGLLEIKCPDKDSVLEVPYLKKDANNILKLNEKDKYYSQVLMQMAVTGVEWCDFFVWTPHDHHLETIHFDSEKWQKMKDKIDIFFHEYFL